MASSVYVETSVISYYMARPSRDIVAAARQAITQEWWNEARGRYEIYISVLVVEEAKAGDAVAEAKVRIGAAIEMLGYECPIICSPEELGGIES